jgi:hypothetical protein
MPTPIERQHVIFQSIKEKRSEVDRLYQDLNKSLRIRELWPNAFGTSDCMQCSPILVGTDWHGGKCPAHLISHPFPYDKVRTVKATYLERSDGVRYDVTEEEFFSIFT